MMTRIENVKEWMKGKVVKDVDDRASNGTTYYFEDNTAVWVEAEPTGIGIPVIVHYEIDPSKPVHEQ